MKYKATNKSKFFKFNPSIFIFIILVFIPKINIISIPGYWQGIRIDDILIFFYLIFFLSNSKNMIFHEKLIYKYFLYFFIYLIISNTIAILSGVKVNIIMLLRLTEYIVLIYFFDNLNINFNKLKKILNIYLYVNLVVAILQNFNLLGSITSLGYMEAEGTLSLNSVGLTGGPWELGVIVSIIFFTLIKLENNHKKLLILFFISNVLLVLAEVRANFLAFNFACLFLALFSKNVKYIYKVYLLTLIFISILSFKYLFSFDFFNKILLIEIDYLVWLFKQGIFYNDLPKIDELKDMNLYLSYWYRIRDWGMFINQTTENNLNILFGIGLKHIYYDSLLIRLFVSTGIIGIIIMIFFSLRLQVYLFIFFIISGAFLDLFVSMKIYFFTLIMLYVQKRPNNNKLIKNEH